MLIDHRPGTCVGGFTPMAAARCKVRRERVIFQDHRVEAGQVLGFEMVTEMTDPIGPWSEDS